MSACLSVRLRPFPLCLIEQLFDQHLTTPPSTRNMSPDTCQTPHGPKWRVQFPEALTPGPNMATFKLRYLTPLICQCPKMASLFQIPGDFKVVMDVVTGSVWSAARKKMTVTEDREKCHDMIFIICTNRIFLLFCGPNRQTEPNVSSFLSLQRRSQTFGRSPCTGPSQGVYLQATI